MSVPQTTEKEEAADYTFTDYTTNANETNVKRCSAAVFLNDDIEESEVRIPPLPEQRERTSTVISA